MNTLDENEVQTVEEHIKPRDIIVQTVGMKEMQKNDDAFYIINLGEVVRRFKEWQNVLPRVQPFYAVKCNPHPAILAVLAALGTGFDCASKTEIDDVMSMGVPVSRIIYAVPCKSKTHLQFAEERNVRLMTFDNEYELYKTKEIFPNAELVIRILADDPNALDPMGDKFGCDVNHTRHLLNVAKNLGLNVVGVSFHVGSFCGDASAYATAIGLARLVFNYASEIGFNFTLLDIGGGYPGTDNGPITIQDIAEKINQSLNEHFPVGCDVRIISEPGLYFVWSACTLTVNVIGKRLKEKETCTNKGAADDTVERTQKERSFMYYCNDSKHMSFGYILSCSNLHYAIVPTLLKPAQSNTPKFSSCIWGQTCDGADLIVGHCLLPELDIGDWIIFEDFGGYTMAVASGFNGFTAPICICMATQSVWSFLKPLLAKVTLLTKKM